MSQMGNGRHFNMNVLLLPAGNAGSKYDLIRLGLQYAEVDHRIKY